MRHAAVFSADEEDRLWDSGAIRTYSPQALVRAVFFYLGKTLCLRGGQEQRNLKPSQFRQEYDPDRYICDRIILCINQPSTYFFKIEIMVLVDRTVLADQGAIFIFRIGSCIMM